MVERFGGKGGFGAIASDNTDQRKGRYWPHKNLTKWNDYITDRMNVVCLDCRQRWDHPRQDPWNSAPKECVKVEVKDESE